MAAFDDEPGAPPAPKTVHTVGQDLSRLSVEEIDARVAALRQEIARLEAEGAKKSSQREAADLLFRR